MKKIKKPELPEPEKTKIGALEKTLMQLGIMDAKLEQKDKGIYYLRFDQTFRISEDKTGIILCINGLRILIEDFCPLFPVIENRAQKALLLKPIIPSRA
ncbi:MAG: hypothetical protein Q8N37_04595 [bacterium]|nr:hypothetical protein [bacterium]